ncbi:T9SS type A sorting domain-containing protein [Flavobacterium sp.]|uniref:T9SS type A sorting domain-containing protein n=1 Tax=Flavobacterium sp. TaxID=239 RepID=UPI003BBB35A8
MKKILLSVIVILAFSISAVAQFTVSKANGTPLTNGQILTFNSIVYAQSSLALKITNTAPNPINLKITCQSMTNTNGQMMEVCFGPDCYGTTAVGDVFPSSGSVNIPTGGVDSSCHLYNSDQGISTSVPLDYVFKIYQVDDLGAQIGTPFIFTYRYDATLSNTIVVGQNSKSVIIKSTTVNNNLDLEVNSKSDFSIYDLSGRLVLENNLDYGTQTIDVSNLTFGLYLINFVNENGDTSSVKFIKK